MKFSESLKKNKDFQKKENPMPTLILLCMWQKTELPETG